MPPNLLADNAMCAEYSCKQRNLRRIFLQATQFAPNTLAGNAIAPNLLTSNAIYTESSYDQCDLHRISLLATRFAPNTLA